MDPSKSTFTEHKAKVVKQIEELKKIYCSDIIFVKIIAKLTHLIKQLWYFNLFNHYKL